jgi:phage-related minor tail protein
MASERDLKELQDQPNRRRQNDHLNREREENDLHKIAEMQELLEKLQKEIAERDTQIAERNTQIAEGNARLADQDKLIEQLKSQRIPSTPPHHSSLTSDGKAFDGQPCTPRAAELTSSRLCRE